MIVLRGLSVSRRSGNGSAGFAGVDSYFGAAAASCAVVVCEIARGRSSAGVAGAEVGAFSSGDISSATTAPAPNTPARTQSDTRGRRVMMKRKKANAGAGSEQFRRRQRLA